MKRFWMAALLACMAIVAVAAQQGTRPTTTAAAQFEAAQKKEVVDGDLAAAIALYRKLAEGADRAVAAKALVRMGECYEKLGAAQKGEARKAYEQAIARFGDQAAVVATARARLAAMGAGAPAPTAGPTVRRLLGEPVGGFVSGVFGSVSSDGRFMAFTDAETGDLALRDLTTGQVRRLTNKGSWAQSNDICYGTAVSADGRRVAYGWFSHNDAEIQLRVWSADDPRPRVLVRPRTLGKGPGPVDGNPDLDIVPIGWNRNYTEILVRRESGGGADIALVSVADGSLRVVKRVADTSTWARLSPDDRFIAYDVAAGPEQLKDIHVVDVAGTTDRVVVEHEANDRAPLWTADGKAVVFLSNRRGSPGLWSVPIFDGAPAGEPVLVKPDVGQIYPMRVTPAGAYIYVTSSENHDVWVASLDPASREVKGPPTRIGERFQGSNLEPALSPDGKWLAHLSRRGLPGAGPTLVIRSLADGQERELATPSFSRATWAPDSGSLFARGREKAGPPTLYRIDLTTGQFTPVPGAPNMDSVALSPDGKSVYAYQTAYDGKTRVSRITRRDVQGGAETDVLRVEHPLFVFGVSPSPDGQLLAALVLDHSTKTQSLRILPASGGEGRDIWRSSPGSMAMSPTWGTARRILFVYGPLTGPRALWQVPVEGGQAVRVGIPGDIMWGGESAAGDRLAYWTRAPHDELWALENFLSVKK
jgi:Tol biopolymer transport system component